MVNTRLERKTSLHCYCIAMTKHLRETAWVKKSSFWCMISRVSISPSLQGKHVGTHSSGSVWQSSSQRGRGEIKNAREEPWVGLTSKTLPYRPTFESHFSSLKGTIVCKRDLHVRNWTFNTWVSGTQFRIKS